MGGVHHHHVDAGGDQCGNTFAGIGAGAHRRAYAQAAQVILGGQRIGLGLLDITEGHQAAQVEVLVDHQHLLDAVFVELDLHLFQRGAFTGGDQLVLRSHDRGDGVAHVRLEAQVAAGDYAHQFALVHHREAGEAVLAGDLQQLDDLGGGGDGHRVTDDGGLVTLDLAHFGSLLLDGHVLVDDADAAFLGHGDGQAGFGHRIHRGGHQRDVQFDAAGQAGLEADILRQNLGITRDQENVVEGQGFLADTQHGGGSQAGKLEARHYNGARAFAQRGRRAADRFSRCRSEFIRERGRQCPRCVRTAGLHLHSRLKSLLQSDPASIVRPHLAHGKAQPLGKSVEEGLGEGRFAPAIEDEAQIGKTAGLQEQEAVDVVLEAAFRAAEVVRVARPPVFQAVEQRRPHFPAALRAARFIEESTRGRIDAALVHQLQSVHRLAEGQSLRLLHHLPRPCGNGIGHAIATQAAGARQRLDHFALGQPAQHAPGQGLVPGHAGYLRHYYQLALLHLRLLRQWEGRAA
ncbi:hypothetical protein D3C85_839360 [compost metagenome]